MITGWVMAGKGDWRSIRAMLESSEKLMTLGLLGVEGVLFELVIAQRRL